MQSDSPSAHLYSGYTNPFPSASSHTHDMLQSLASLLLDSIHVADAQMLHGRTLWGGHLGSCCWTGKPSLLFVSNTIVMLMPFSLSICLNKANLGSSYGIGLTLCLEGSKFCSDETACGTVFASTLQPRLMHCEKCIPHPQMAL